MSAEASPPVPPRLIVSRPAEDPDAAAAAAVQAAANSPTRPTLASRRRRRKTESSALKGSGRKPSVEWIDIDDPSREKKTTRRHHRATSVSSSSGSGSRSRRNTEGEVGSGGFLPKLGRILEGTSESRSTSRPTSSTSTQQKLSSSERNSTTRRHRHRDDVSVGYRRPVKHRVGGVNRRQESGFKVNPSLFSVLSTLTRTSDRSSSSNTTITQASYDRKKECWNSKIAPAPAADRRLPETEAETPSTLSNKGVPQPSVFDYMESGSGSTNMDDGQDGRSVYSNSSTSSSSHYEQSDAGSSELPGTPSSHSTFPSPTSTRNPSLCGSVAELRRKYDVQPSSSPMLQSLARSGSHSPEIGTRGVKKSTKVRAVPEEEQSSNVEPKTKSDASQDEHQRSSSGSSRSSRAAHRHEERLRYQEGAMQQHLSQSHPAQQHVVDPTYGQHRSQSASSHGSAGSARAYAQYMAMQQYQYPSPPVPTAYPIPPQAMNGHADRPPVPDPPDFSQTTVAGYEQLALELSRTESQVKPIYRKFEYLNHRILLHLQDELSEMEEQLRTIDEIIAQMEPSPSDDQAHPPASRRGDAFNGTEMHYRRTALLGRIFLKTEQYNKAMTSFASMSKDVRSAEQEQISAYQEWLKTKAPIHEVETRFLQKEGDLILPGQGPQIETTSESHAPTKQAALTCIPVALMLPLLLFALIPTLAGRLVVTSLIAVGAFMVAATTRIRFMLPAHEWAVCGGAYVLVMAAIAGCIPQYGVK